MTRCFPKNPVLLFQFQRAGFLSQLSCYASVQLRHFLIHNSCSLLVHPHTKASAPPPFFFSPAPPNCNFESHDTKYVFIIPFCTLLMACAYWYVWSSTVTSLSLPGQAVICSAEYILCAPCNILLLVSPFHYGNKRKPVCCYTCQHIIAGWVEQMLATCEIESSVAQPILYNGNSYLIRVLLSSHCLIAFKLLSSPAECRADHSMYNLNAII